MASNHMARNEHVMNGSNYNRYGELFVVSAVACDVPNHKPGRERQLYRD